MNFLRIISTTLRRSYSSRPQKSLSGIQGKLQIAGNADSNENFDECLDDDVDAYEGNFHVARQSYKSYEREQEQRMTRLKGLITKQKYFKTKEPKLLTRAQIEQIRLNYAEDPETWTVEEISNKYPISIATAQKIVSSRNPDFSEERIHAWDKAVAENWVKLRKGQLPIDPALRNHVQRFIGKFSSKEERFRNNKLYANSKSDSQTKQPKTKRKFLTIPLEDNKFIRENLEQLYQASPEKAIALVDLYRKKLIEEEEMGLKSNLGQTSECSESKVHDTTMEKIESNTASQASSTTQSTENDTAFGESSVSESTEVLQETARNEEGNIEDLPLEETVILREKSQIIQKNHDIPM